jgi:hypothetical protein
VTSLLYFYKSWCERWNVIRPMHYCLCNSKILLFRQDFKQTYNTAVICTRSNRNGYEANIQGY